MRRPLPPKPELVLVIWGGQAHLTEVDCEQPLFNQSSLSSAGLHGEGEMAERETGFAVSLAWLDFLARVTILSDC